MVAGFRPGTLKRASDLPRPRTALPPESLPGRPGLGASGRPPRCPSPNPRDTRPPRASVGGSAQPQRQPPRPRPAPRSPPMVPARPGPAPPQRARFRACRLLGPAQGEARAARTDFGQRDISQRPLLTSRRSGPGPALPELGALELRPGGGVAVRPGKPEGSGGEDTDWRRPNTGPRDGATIGDLAGESRGPGHAECAGTAAT